tara:strand:- start:394 stop:498 length:105 start_codon:yes stop_codon:yes gene_type:complete
MGTEIFGLDLVDLSYVLYTEKKNNNKNELVISSQ